MAIRSRFRRVSSWFGCVAVACCLAPVASPASPIRVVTIGDSITRGASSSPEGPGWVELLAQQLGKSCEVVNVARDGSSTLDWSGLNGGPSYFDLFAESELPADLVLIMLGTIDSTGLGELAPVSEQQYRQALEVLVLRSLFAGAGEVLLTGPPPAWFQPFGTGRLYAYQGVVAELCAEHALIRCGPDLYGLLDIATDFAHGDAHPNATGHAKIAAAFIAYVPEPSTASLVGCGLVALGLCRRRG